MFYVLVTALHSVTWLSASLLAYVQLPMVVPSTYPTSQTDLLVLLLLFHLLPELL